MSFRSHVGGFFNLFVVLAICSLQSPWSGEPGVGGGGRKLPGNYAHMNFIAPF